jgi:hypothetical protein
MSFKTKQEFLVDTLEYYTENPGGRRCKNEFATCAYHPTTLKKDASSEGCAIGRHLDEADALYLDTEHNGTDIKTILFDKGISKLIPDWMKAFGEDFLVDVQEFHDWDDYWDLDNDKLSGDGKNKLEGMIGKYKLDRNQFSKYLN